MRVIEFTDGAYGDEDHSPQEIRINRDLSDTQKMASLIHEVMGVCNATMHGNDLMHALLEAQAQQLTQVLIDNDMLK